MISDCWPIDDDVSISSPEVTFLRTTRATRGVRLLRISLPAGPQRLIARLADAVLRLIPGIQFPSVSGILAACSTSTVYSDRLLRSATGFAPARRATNALADMVRP